MRGTEYNYLCLPQKFIILETGIVPVSCKHERGVNQVRRVSKTARICICGGKITTGELPGYPGHVMKTQAMLYRSYLCLLRILKRPISDLNKGY